MVDVAQKLNQASGMKKVFFANSGAEANEGMIKIARKYSWDHYHDENRLVILTLKQSFHGRTIATLEATGQDHFHQSFSHSQTALIIFRRAVFQALQNYFATHKIAGLMMELVQGESSMRPLDPQFVCTTGFCQKHDVLLMIDEVQTGIGRNRKIFRLSTLRY